MDEGNKGILMVKKQGEIIYLNPDEILKHIDKCENNTLNKNQNS